MTPEERAEYERRMRLPPVPIEGEGEEFYIPDLPPVRIEGEGETREIPDVELSVGEPTISRRVAQPRPQAPIEDPALAKLVSGLGGVADRAQAGMAPSRVSVQMGEPTELARVEQPSGPRPGGIPAQVAQFVMSATGRKPLVSSGGDSGQVSPAMDAPKPPSDDEKLQKALEFARKRQGLGNVGAALTEQLAIANGRDASGTVNRMRADAAAPVSDAQSKLEQAKKFILDKQRRDREFAQDSAANERADRTEKRGMEAQEYERTRQGERDALNKRLVESQITENQAQADKLQRRRDAGGAKAKPPAQIPAEAAGNLAELEAGGGEVDALGKEWDELASAWHSGITQFIPGTDAKQFDDARLAGAQRIGTILEQGKLTDSDLKDKYLPLMPSQSDSKERKDAKLARLKRMLQSSREARVKGLGEAGFNTSGIDKGQSVGEVRKSLQGNAARPDDLGAPREKMVNGQRYIHDGKGWKRAR